MWSKCGVMGSHRKSSPEIDLQAPPVRLHSPLRNSSNCQTIGSHRASLWPLFTLFLLEGLPSWPSPRLPLATGGPVGWFCRFDVRPTGFGWMQLPHPPQRVCLKEPLARDDSNSLRAFRNLLCFPLHSFCLLRCRWMLDPPSVCVIKIFHSGPNRASMKDRN